MIIKMVITEFVIEKCAMLIMKSGNKETVERIEPANQEANRVLGEKKNYMYLPLFKADTIKHAGMKEKIVHQMKLNTIAKGINTKSPKG